MQPNEEYGFITSPQSPLGQNASGGGSSKKKLILFGGGALVVLIIIISAVVAITNKGPENENFLLDVAIQQNEVIRISELALKQAKNADVRKLAVTTKISLQTDQPKLAAALKAQKVKIPKASKNNKNDQTLLEATQNNRFDQVVMEMIQAQLGDYQKKINVAYKTSESKQLKDALKAQYINASMLIGVDPTL